MIRAAIVSAGIFWIIMMVSGLASVKDLCVKIYTNPAHREHTAAGRPEKRMNSPADTTSAGARDEHRLVNGANREASEQICRRKSKRYARETKRL